jgi:Acetyltransferase (GNAT) family
MGHPAKVSEMSTLFSEIHNLYLKCYKDSSPHPIAAHNASNYLMQLLATCEVTVVRRKEQVVGVIIYQIFHNTLLNQRELFIHEWFIHPIWRKKLVGHQLYDAIIKIGKGSECARLRGISSNPQMISVICSRGEKEGKAVGLMFEKEL